MEKKLVTINDWKRNLNAEGSVMKRLVLLILLPAFSVAFTFGTIHAQEIKGPRIVLEEEEIIVMENGVEAQRAIVSKRSEERERIMTGVREKVWKKLGVSSDIEMNNKKLNSKYNEEMNQRVRVKELDPPKLKFIDASGNVIKEIDMKPAVQKQVRKLHPRLKKPHLIKETIAKHVDVFNDGKYVLLAESVGDVFLPETEEERKMIGDTDADYMGSHATIILIDVAGDTLWTKKIPQNMGIENTAVSDDGEKIAYIQVYVMGGLEASEPYEKLCVFDKNGEEIFSFPKERTQGYRLYADSTLLMSVNGRYLSVRGSKNKEQIKLFIDVINKSVWEAPERYGAFKITNDGVVFLSHPDLRETDPKTLNLKKYLGE